MLKKYIKNKLSAITRFVVQNKLSKYSNLDFNSIENSAVLIISPHPDDEVIGLGGYILKARKEGNKILLLFLTDGEASGAHQDNEIIKTKRRELTSRITTQMGIPEEQIFRLGLADGKVPREGEAGFKEASEKIVAILEKETPDLVFATHPLDFWPYDHVACAELAKTSLKKSSKKSLLFYYWVWAWYHLKPWQVSKIDFSNYFRIEIDKELPQKIEFIKQYIEPLAPSNKPWSGELPKTLIKGNTQDFEVLEKIDY